MFLVRISETHMDIWFEYSNHIMFLNLVQDILFFEEMLTNIRVAISILPGMICFLCRGSLLSGSVYSQQHLYDSFLGNLHESSVILFGLSCRKCDVLSLAS